MNNHSRREFAKLSAMGLATIPLLGFQNILETGKSVADEQLSVHLFSKHLQFLNYNDMSAAAVDMGFD
jgi:hypothetical protein